MQKAKDGDEPLAVPLWPDTGRALGLSKNPTYAAADAGQIPTIRLGRLRRVPYWFYKACREGTGGPEPVEGARREAEPERRKSGSGP